MKKYGVSKRLKRIRDDFFSLHDKQREAYNKGDYEAFEQLNREFYEYSRRYKKELRISAEQIEDMKIRLAEAEKIRAELAYLAAKKERLNREVEKEERELEEMLLEEEKRGHLKWN